MLMMCIEIITNIPKLAIFLKVLSKNIYFHVFKVHSYMLNLDLELI